MCRPTAGFVQSIVPLVVLTLVGSRAVAADLPVDRLLAQADDASAMRFSTETRTAALDHLPEEHPLIPAIRLAQKSLQKLESIEDYEARLVKQERLDGKLVQQTMQLRLREKPFSVYVRFDGEFAGREFLYFQGKHNNQLLAREGSGLKSLVGTVSLATDGVEAMQENRYPITMIGMRRMLESVLSQWASETRAGEVNVQFYPDAQLGNRSCQVIETTYPQMRKQFRFHKTRLYLDTQSRLPVRVEQYAFPAMPGMSPPLEEEYTYSRIRTNVGLSDRDFSTEHPDYNF